MSANFEQLEAQLKTLGENKGILTTSKKQAIRDRVFQSIGQIELADAIATGEAKAGLAVSLKHLQKALIPQRLSFSMPATIATVVVVFMASIITGAAAQSSRPGEALFNVKKVLETLEIAVTSNPIKKAELTLNIADQRVKDLEASVGQEEALHTVLQESQTALVSARATIQKAKDSGDTAGAAALLDKFNTLLADQKTILDDIEKAAPSEDVKQTIVAIRDAIEEANELSEGAGIVEQPNQNAVATNPMVPKPIVKPVIVTTPLTLAVNLTGFQTLAGRISTAGGQPALFFNGNQYLIITTSPISLQEYIGSNNVALSGLVKDGHITVYRVVINGAVLADIPFSLTNPVSTGGNSLTGLSSESQAENPDKSINQE